MIDKDFCAELRAHRLDARILLLLTGVERVSIGFGTPEQRELTDLSLADLERYAAEGHFPPGSMGPKMAAAADFLRRGGDHAIVTTPSLAGRALAGGAGTTIRRT